MPDVPCACHNSLPSVVVGGKNKKNYDSLTKRVALFLARLMLLQSSAFQEASAGAGCGVGSTATREKPLWWTPWPERTPRHCYNRRLRAIRPSFPHPLGNINCNLSSRFVLHLNFLCYFIIYSHRFCKKVSCTAFFEKLSR